SRQITLDLDDEVELAPAVRTRRAGRLPILDMHEPRLAPQTPPGLLGDLAAERVEQRLATFDVSANEVPASRQERAIRPATMHERATGRVEDQRRDDGPPALGFGAILQPGEVDAAVYAAVTSTVISARMSGSRRASTR